MIRRIVHSIAPGLLFWALLAPCGLLAGPQQGELPENRGDWEKNAIAFTSSLSGSWQIWTMNPDGGNLTPLTRGPEEFFYPAWSPDGQAIACADGNGEIRVLHKDGRSDRLSALPPDCTHPAWSPDGSRIALVCNTFSGRKEESDLWVADLKRGKVSKLMEQPDIQKYPNWSPDGSTIAYTTGFRASATKVVEELWLVNSDGTNPRTLVSNNFSNIRPNWSPDGSKIAFASDRSGNMDIWVVDKDGRNLKQLTREKFYEGDPSWSPDGKSICFSATRSGRMQVWVMDADGANQRQLTGSGDTQSEGREPSWSR
jgi:TolB protein